jgi:hypothetical protein
MRDIQSEMETTQAIADVLVPTMRCVQDNDECVGEVAYRDALSPTGRRFPRCDSHWEKRLVEQDRINATYPYNAPSGFDPADAGERWDDDY